MKDLSQQALYYDCIETKVGKICLAGDEAGLRSVSFQEKLPITVPDSWTHSPTKMAEATRQMKEYLAGTRKQFDLPLAPLGTLFQQRVWAVLTEIPYGKTITYGELADRAGNPRASRAVGNANGQNPIVIIQPCHRVIAANSQLGGFSAGLHRKKFLLRLERGMGSMF